ncbi:hypothetical protein BDZ91DRAFT_723953 [Kalaharituber pfeilii]|nr:hypothetical protein BDZ91DRAFT_723953 [Kalaharituber pfeilii]
MHACAYIHMLLWLLHSNVLDAWIIYLRGHILHSLLVEFISHSRTTHSSSQRIGKAQEVSVGSETLCRTHIDVCT